MAINKNTPLVSETTHSPMGGTSERREAQPVEMQTTEKMEGAAAGDEMTDELSDETTARMAAAQATVDTDEDNVVSMASWRESISPTHGAKADSDEIQEEVRHHRKSNSGT